MTNGDNECNKHMPKIRVCDIKPGYRFEKKQVCLYDFDEREKTEIECDELLYQDIRTVSKPQWFLRVRWCPKYEWVQKNVETTEKFWNKKKVEVPVKRFCTEKVEKKYDVYEVACDWKKECKEIECREVKESNCGCDEEEQRPRPPKPCHKERHSYSSRSESGASQGGAPSLPGGFNF